MHAALVTDFAAPPHLGTVDEPTPSSGEEVVTVLASAIHPRVRSQADGSHYSSTGGLPFVPGIDGIARDSDGRLRYFVTPDGAMAERALIDPRRSVVLPDDIDPVAMAAAMNPAMSSWIALRRRIRFAPGSRVLIMGATGNAGRLAVQIARRLGAGHITAAGRKPAALAALPGLGADAVIDLRGGAPAVNTAFAEAGREVDVVLDYLWGDWAARALAAIVPARDDDSRSLTWVQIGSLTGAESPIPSAALRACNLRIMGSGQGSVAPRDILAELPALATEVTGGGYDLRVRAMPLASVTHAWEESSRTDERIVLVPTEGG